MSTLPPSPFISDFGVAVTAPNEAAASLRQVEDAAVEYVDLDQIDCIGEIFVGARKLESRFILDEQAFMDAIEPPPLFLQRAAG